MPVKEIRKMTNPRKTSCGKGIVVDVELVWDNGSTEQANYCAMPDDSEDHGRQIYKEAFSGKYGKVADYVKS